MKTGPALIQNRPRAEAPSPARRRLLVVAITDGGPAGARSGSRCGDRGIAIPVTRGGTVPDAKATVGLMRAFRAEQVSARVHRRRLPRRRNEDVRLGEHVEALQQPRERCLRRRGHARNRRRSSSHRAAARRCCWSSGAGVPRLDSATFAQRAKASMPVPGRRLRGRSGVGVLTGGGPVWAASACPPGAQALGSRPRRWTASMR
jgi:hypothetical protein